MDNPYLGVAVAAIAGRPLGISPAKMSQGKGVKK